MKIVLFCLLLVVTAMMANAVVDALISTGGSVQVSVDGRSIGSIDPGLFENTWQSATATTGKKVADGVFNSVIKSPTGKMVDVVITVTPANKGVRVQYKLTPREEMMLNSLHVAINMPVAYLAGGSFIYDRKEKVFPDQLGEVALSGGNAKSLALIFPDKQRINFKFDSITPVLVQDDRKWVSSFTFRIGPQFQNAEKWDAGRSQIIDFTLSNDDGITYSMDEGVTITAGKDWLPLEYEKNVEPGSIVDLSPILAWHYPSGKYGRVIAGDNGHFVFEKMPKAPQRFYGCNLCFTGQYIPHDQADLLAERLVRSGYNTIRIHHYESELIDRAAANSYTLRQDSLDQLDYLISAFKKRGIYITTDLFVSRPVAAKEIWEGAAGDVGMDNFKMAILVNDKAYNNYCKFALELMNHKNPYTETRLAEDPTLAWINLINEGNAGNFLGRCSDNVNKDWQAAWNKWLLKNYPNRVDLVTAMGTLPDDQDAAKGNIPLVTRFDDTPKGILSSRFCADTEKAFTVKMRDFMKAIGCKAMITNLNSWTNPAQMQDVRRDYDYVDDHFYVDHPEFIEKPWQLPSRCSNSSPVAAGAPGGRYCSFHRLADKPFTISEYNYAAPSRFRGVGGMLTSAMAATQDWSALWRFAYSHTRNNIVNQLPLSYFDMASDPLNQAADRVASVIFRRGDLKPAKHLIAIVMTPDELNKDAKTDRDMKPAWDGLALVTRVGTMVAADKTKLPVKADMVLNLTETDETKINPYKPDAGEKILAEIKKAGWLVADNNTDLNKNIFQSESGEFTVDSRADVFTLNTPNTFGGYAPAGSKIIGTNMEISIIETGATVTVTSMDNRPIKDSSRMLITHLTDLQDTNTKYAEKARRTLLAWGSLPYLVRTGTATVKIKVKDPAKTKVWGVTTAGKRTEEIKITVEGGQVVIPLDVNDNGKARMLYEVAVEN
ncbi:MAG: hypothetical protein WCO98_07080 [bacterium]